MVKSASTILLVSEGFESEPRLANVVRGYLPECTLLERTPKALSRLAASQLIDAVIFESEERDLDVSDFLARVSGNGNAGRIPVLQITRDAGQVARAERKATDRPAIDRVSWKMSDGELGARLQWMVRAKRAEDAAKDADENLERMLNTHREELASKDRRYRRLLEIWPQMVAVFSEGVITYVNDAGRKMLGRESIDDLVGQPAAELVHPESRALLKKMITDCHVQNERPPYVLMRVLTESGASFPVEAAAVCTGAGDGGPVLLVLRDLIDKKERSERFQQSQRMEAVGQLAGGVAHDFNNILTTIRGYSDIILDSVNPEDPLCDDAREIKNATERAAALTRQLLAFSRRQVMEPAPLDLNQVVINIERMLQRVIGENIELTTDLEPDIGIVRADRSRIEQVIMNLAVNSRDAIEESGRLLLKTSNEILGDMDDRWGLDLPAGPYVMLEMTDTGVGMSQQTLYRIFEPFFTTKEHDRGTGLGLSTVYGIVKQSDGDIAVASEVGKGTSFRVFLPIVPALVAAMAPVRTERGAARGVETILLVEDDKTVRYMTKRLLERAGYTVLPAGNGTEALTVCEQHTGDIDLIVTDVVMPEMGGLALVERLLTRNPKLRAIFMSGYSDKAVLEVAESVDRVAFLQKPFSYAELTRKVRGVLDDTIN